MDIERIKKSIRNVPDFPKPGIQFKDITTLLQDSDVFQETIDIFYQQLKDKEIETKPQNKMIVFIEDTDPILDLEGNEIGPFKKGDIANLAEEVATILIGDKKADSVDEE